MWLKPGYSRRNVLQWTAAATIGTALAKNQIARAANESGVLGHEGKRYTIKLGSSQPTHTQNAHTVFFEKFVEVLVSKTNGNLGAIFYGDSQLGPEAKYPNQLNAGTLDMMMAISDFSPIVPDIAVLTMGFLFDSLERLGQVMDGDAGTVLAGIFKKKTRAEILGWCFNFGGRNVLSKAPITTPAEFHGKKLRACWWLNPLYDLVVSTVLSSEKIFADDTTLPVLDPGRGRTKTGRLWCYAVDDRPWSGPTHPAAAYVYSENRKGAHPSAHLAAFRGVLQVDGYAGFKRLAGDRSDDSVKLAFCWAHMRRPFFEFYESTKSPLAGHVLARIRELYAIEAEIRGHPADHRQRVRQARSRPIVDALHAWLQEQIPRVSAVSELAKAMRYAIRHWPGLVAFLDDGRIEMDTNVVERSIRPVTLTRKNALFAGSDGGARHWSVAMTLIETAKLNGVEPMAWLTDVLERIVSKKVKANALETLLPWNWRPTELTELAAAA
jgi:hypothetical protein